MARAGPKSKKQKAAPKSKKEKVEEPVKKAETDSDVEDEVEKKDVSMTDSENENGNDGKTNDHDEESEDEEPPAKKGRGRSASKKAKSPKGKSASNSKTRKTPAAKGKAKKAESEEEDDKEYEVDYILNDRTSKGKTQYLIKWKGYSKAQSTWEPVDNLNCDEAIQKYQEKQEKIKNTPARSLREERKETERYVDVAGSGDVSRRRHSRRNAAGKSPRKSYREAPDSD